MEDAIAPYFVKHFRRGCTRWHQLVCLEPHDPIHEEQLIVSDTGTRADCMHLIAMMQEYYPTLQFTYHPYRRIF